MGVGVGGSPRSSLSSSSAVVGLMTPSTSKPAKLLTSLWMRLSCRGGGEEGGGMPRRGEEAKPLRLESQHKIKGYLDFLMYI